MNFWKFHHLTQARWGVGKKEAIKEGGKRKKHIHGKLELSDLQELFKGRDTMRKYN